LATGDLRVTPDEAATLLNEVMGLDLSAEDVAVLKARTEGWVAGLQLAALSMQGKATERVASFIAAFGGSHRHVIDYLAEEMMSQQSDVIRDFLCQTAILNRLTSPLCDAVTGRDDSAVILAQLEQANLFLVPLDDQREWYRYHHPFADFLRNRLNLDLPDQVNELHRQASEWHEHNGFMAAAIDRALSAEDFRRTAYLIEKVAEATLMRSEVATFLGWLKALPNTVIRSWSYLHLAHAWGLVTAGQLDAAEPRVQEAIQAASVGDVRIEGGMAPSVVSSPR